MALRKNKNSWKKDTERDCLHQKKTYESTKEMFFLLKIYRQLNMNKNGIIKSRAMFPRCALSRAHVEGVVYQLCTGKQIRTDYFRTCSPHNLTKRSLKMYKTTLNIKYFCALKRH